MKKKNIVISILIVLTLVFSGLNFSMASEISLSSEVSPLTKDYRALLVAVGDYNGDGDTNDEHDLKNTVNDINLLEETLYYGYTGYIKTILTDRSATKENFEAEIDNLISNAGPNDVSLIYFSGHGGYDGKNSNLYLFELEKYWDYEFADKISKIPGYVVVGLDSCHNYGFVNDIVDDVYAIENEWVSRDIIMFTAHEARDSNYGWDDLGHGFFTFSFISSLMAGDTNEDNKATVGEVFNVLSNDYDYILNRVGIISEFEANLDYTRSESLDIALIKGFSNKKPDITSFSSDITNDGKLTLTMNLDDPEDKDVELFVYWGRGQRGSWTGPYSSYYGEVERSNTYQNSNTYDVLVIARDNYGSNHIKVASVQITTKQKTLRSSLFTNFPLFQQLFQKLNL